MKTSGHSGATDILTILRRVPGLEVMQMNGADFNVSVRGNNQTGANKILVMVDGRSIYNDEGTVNWCSLPVTLPEIKRIEVLKGPASAVGIQCLRRRINIITRRRRKCAAPRYRLVAEISALTTSAVHRPAPSTSLATVCPSVTTRMPTGPTERTGFRDSLVNVLTTYALSGNANPASPVAWSIRIAVQLDSQPGRDQPLRLDPGGMECDHERPNFFIRAFWNLYDSNSLVRFNPRWPHSCLISLATAPRRGLHIGNTYNLDLQHAFELSPSNRLTYGANYRYNTLLSSNSTSEYSMEHRFGLFLQDEWNLARSLTMIAGVRYDLDSFIHPTGQSPHRTVYNISRQHWWISGASVAHRPPTSSLVRQRRVFVFSGRAAALSIPYDLGSVPSTAPDEQARGAAHQRHRNTRCRKFRTRPLPYVRSPFSTPDPERPYPQNHT
ncbi:MAG: TonB-dependent receptor [Nitrospiraceae bacterium]